MKKVKMKSVAVVSVCVYTYGYCDLRDARQQQQNTKRQWKRKYEKCRLVCWIQFCLLDHRTWIYHRHVARRLITHFIDVLLLYFSSACLFKWCLRLFVSVARFLLIFHSSTNWIFKSVALRRMTWWVYEKQLFH